MSASWPSLRAAIRASPLRLNGGRSSRRAVGISLQLTVISLSVFAVALGCGGSIYEDISEDISRDPFDYPQFLTPIAEAESAGITPYWLGKEFQAASVEFNISLGSDFVQPIRDEVGLHFEYGGDIGNGFVPLLVTSHPSEGTAADELRRYASSVPGASAQTVKVGTWKGELWSIPGGARPVNALILLVHANAADVVVYSPSGSTGVPGEDLNPLLEAELLLDVVEQHLRRFPG